MSIIFKYFLDRVKMPKRRGRSESMIKLANQQKESKLWHEEANSQVKAGNLIKALYSYNKVS